jgi:DNA-binding transcriptional LysR family regulator
MDRLDELRAFVVAVDRGGLSAAARALGRSPASITRAVASLEDRLHVPLLRRTTRSLKLTEAGERYIVVARRVLADLDEAEKATGEGNAAPQGLLTVTAPLAFGSLHVRPILDAFLAAHEGLRARLLLLDRVVSIVDEGVDVAIRIAHLPDSALVAIPVGTVRRVVVASPDYIARFGRPKDPGALAEHRCISSAAITPTDVWTFGGRPGKRVTVRPILTANIAEAATRSAMNGLGITCAISYQVTAQLAMGTLVRVLAPYEPPPLPVHVVYPATSARTAKVRAFVAAAVPRLRAVLEERTADEAAPPTLTKRREEPPRRSLRTPPSRR